jgi:putative N6-adenine-specific DNA methylase
MASWFAVVPPGLEPVVARELSWLGVSGEVVTGGVDFEASVEEGAELSALVRTPSRLLLRIAEGEARSLRDLSRLVASVDWQPFFRDRVRVKVSASCSGSRLARRDFVTSKVESALSTTLRQQLTPFRGRPPRLEQRLLVRVDNDLVTLSLDAGGELLHRRGWRTSSVRAPIRENLAAAMLVAAGWDGSEALFDPFCGSGTLPIEAALLASQQLPWTKRSFAWEEWPVLSAQRPPRSQKVPVTVPIVGSDHDAGSIEACEDNARRAGVVVEWRLGAVRDIEPPAASGLVVANPPYGHRLGQRIRGVYVRFGHALRDRFSGWRVAFLAPNDRLARATHEEARRLTTFHNGGIRVGLFIIESL